MRVVIYEHPAVPCEAAAKRRGDWVVVLLRPGLDDARREQLLGELLTDEELAVIGRQETVL